MPGVSVTTSVRVGPVGADGTSSAFFLVGSAERGPVDRGRLVVGLNQFEAIYGDYKSNFTLWDYVKTFFEEGGNRCYVSRGIGAGNAVASVPVLDGDTDTSFTLYAKNPGEWANTSGGVEGLKAIVTTTAGATTIEIYYKGSVVFTAGPFEDETLPDSSIKYAKQFIVEAINAAPSLSELLYAAVGDGVLNPESGTYSLVGGADGSAVTDSEIVSALELFDYDMGAGAVSAPGWAGSTIWNALRDHAIANRRIALCGFEIGTSKTTAINDASSYWGSTAALREKGSYMAFFWPSIKVPDGYGSVRDQAPEAYVAAARARAHQSTGSWRAGAGEISTARYVTGLYEQVTRVAGDNLDDNRVNALRVINGAVRVYGARSISSDEINWRFITYRDTLNYVTAQAESTLEPLVFRPIDGRGSLFGEIEARLIAIMEPVRVAGGSYPGFDEETGRPLDPGYSVNVSSVNNPTNSLAAGIVSASIGVRVSPVADKYNITITKSTLTASV